MANVDRPSGLTPVNGMGQAYVGRVSPYYIQSDYATALFIGDPVVITGESNTTEIDGFGPGMLPSINKATAGATNALSGVIVGFSPLRTDLTKQYNPASTARIAYVCDDPEQLFEVQDDGAGAPATGSIGLNAVLVYTHAGSAYTGRSGAELSFTTAPAADATYQLTIMRLSPRFDNEVGDSAKWIVRINLHTAKAVVVGL